MQAPVARADVLRFSDGREGPEDLVRVRQVAGEERVEEPVGSPERLKRLGIATLGLQRAHLADLLGEAAIDVTVDPT